MNILAIETSSEACSCALLGAGGVLEERFEVAPRRHTERVLPMARELLAGQGLTLAGLDALAYGSGPGSFTGVRIAACVVQGLALAASKTVIAVSTLAALAARGGRPGEQVLAAFDARMGELYVGTFRIDEHGLPVAVRAEQLATPQAALLPGDGQWVGLGAGWRAHGETLRLRLGARLSRVDDTLLPGAAEVARLAAAGGTRTAPAAALPGYLRREVATVSGSR